MTAVALSRPEALALGFVCDPTFSNSMRDFAPCPRCHSFSMQWVEDQGGPMRCRYCGFVRTRTRLIRARLRELRHDLAWIDTLFAQARIAGEIYDLVPTATCVRVCGKRSLPSFGSIQRDGTIKLRTPGRSSQRRWRNHVLRKIRDALLDADSVGFGALEWHTLYARHYDGNA